MQFFDEIWPSGVIGRSKGYWTGHWTTGTGTDQCLVYVPVHLQRFL